VLTTPVIRCLKKQVEHAEIHFVTKKSYESVLRNNPYIHKLWLFDGDLKKLVDELTKQQFDYVIDLHHNLRTSVLKRKLRMPAFEFNKINLQKWLIVNFKINRLPDTHIVDRYMETTRVFDVENDNEGLDFFLSEEDQILPAAIEKQVPGEFISLVIGAQHNTKKMPPSSFAEIIKKITFPVVILGGADDREAADEICRLSGKPSNLLNTCGELSLNQSASLVKRSSVVITHDTGLMHIAAAFKRRIISIWGNTIPEFGMFPYKPHPDSIQFEVRNLRCRPCSKIGFQKCPKKHFRCMLEQDIDGIARQAIELMKK